MWFCSLNRLGQCRKIYISKLKSSESIAFIISCSYLELYLNSEGADLPLHLKKNQTNKKNKTNHLYVNIVKIR